MKSQSGTKKIKKMRAFQTLIRSHHVKHSRHDLPWRKTHDPYRILVSEIMLQQTQVSRVLTKYEEFLAAFPTLQALAKAPTSQVLKIWQGLGYNRRALNLKRTAERIMDDFGGRFPTSPDDIESLPGIGRSTCGAVMAFAFGMAIPFIETNIRAVYIHHFFKKAPMVSDAELLPVIEQTLDRQNPREWYYALMDYGVHLKATLPNPSRRSKHHARQSPFKDSNREMRARMLRLILEEPQTESAVIAHFIKLYAGRKTERDIQRNIKDLECEGFIIRKRIGKRNMLSIA